MIAEDSRDTDFSNAGVLCMWMLFSEVKNIVEQCTLKAGIPRNDEEAYFWLSLVTDNKLHVQEIQKEVLKRLSSEQLKMIESRRKKWKPVKVDIKISPGVDVATLAEQGDAVSQVHMGSMLLWEDAEEAVKWFRRAAEQGDDDAKFYLGQLYAAGQGDETDIEVVKRFSNALDKINNFIVANNPKPVTKSELEAKSKMQGLAYGCVGAEDAKPMIDRWKKVPAEKFEVAVEKLLSVPREPKSEPCL